MQGLDIGSKLKYRGVAIGEVTRIGFTYNKYQQDRPMAQRARYVLVEAQIQPRLLGGRAGAGDLTEPRRARRLEVERGLRVRLAPQGITGTSYLEIDYVDPPPPVLPIDWTPDNIYIPSAPSTVTALVNAATEIMDRLHKLDIEGTLANLNKLLVTTNDARRGGRHQGAVRSAPTACSPRWRRTLDELDDEEALRRGASRCWPSCARSNAELKKTLVEPGAAEAARRRGGGGCARARDRRRSRTCREVAANLSRSLARIDRILGGGEADLTVTIENLRQITDNLRDLTEDAKRYPANVIFGAPPRPFEGK